MKRLLVPFCLTLIIFIGSAGVSASADFQKGLTAYKSKDYATALREWKPLAKQGDADAQYYLGAMYDKGQGVPQNDKTAVKWFKLAAEQGYADAQNYLGVMYEDGEGVPQNHKTAVKWYRLAAKQGHDGAQNNLGAMYEEGQGVKQDLVYAHIWRSIANMNGNFLAWMEIDSLEEKMTPAQIAEAQKLAQECIRKKYKGC